MNDLEMRPNMRLKLAGGDRSMGIGVLGSCWVVPWRARTFGQRPSAGA